MGEITPERIGIMGGTFDPVHYGHLLAAQEALYALQLSQVIFVPTGDSWQKSSARRVTPADERYMMTFLATLDNPKFSVSRIEIDRGEASHTVDTLREMRYWYSGSVDFYFITGIDALMTMDTWAEYEEIPKLCTIVAASRPGFHSERYHLDNFPESLRSKIRLLDIPLLSISSTEIRRRVAADENLRYLLPHPVEQYIYKRRLYKS